MTKKASNNRTGRGSVLFIVLLFLASGLIRLSAGAGPALAEAGKLVPVDKAVSKATVGPSYGEISALLEALQAREARIEEQEQKLGMRAKALEVVDAEVKERLARLEQVEKSLQDTLALADQAAEGDIARLTTVYENMKPKDAAALFETMEHSFAAGFIARMRPEAAASVMAGLSPEAAYAISVILASRNASVPKT